MFEFFDKWFRAKSKPAFDSGTLTGEPVVVRAEEHHRLTQEVYMQLERECSRLAVGPATTELQAGFQLGVASVLERLRNGIVIGR